jgi:hypothetical protein
MVVRPCVFILLGVAHPIVPSRRATNEERREKGCGIGCVLAVNSCEGVGSVDARTVAAPDAITAFAIPNGCSSQSQSVFSGLAARQVALSGGSPSLLRTGNM